MSLNPTTEHFDVIIVGSGVAGALAADRLVKKGKNVCIIEAGGYATDERNRDRMLDYYVGSPSKATDAPFCGDEVLAEQPNPRRSPDGLNIEKLPDGANYYYYPPDYATPNDPQKRDKFLSYYERVVGGSTWHWQGIYVRMIPSDFTMSDFGIDTSKLTSDPSNFSLDWPLSYSELEPDYVAAEQELGVSGDPPNERLYRSQRRDRKRPQPYPMPSLVPSYLDRKITQAVRQKRLTVSSEIPKVHVQGLSHEDIALNVTTVPHAILSHDKDGRQACDGRTSCVPLCPTGARYDATIHLWRARQNHNPAKLITQAVVKNLKLDDDGRRVLGVNYQKWRWDDQKRTRVADGDLVYASADIVVLAANGIENPMILLRTAVPGKTTGAANTSGMVGKYLMDHPIKQSYAVANEDLFPFRGPQTTSQIEDFRDGKFRKHYSAFKISLKNDGWMTNAAGAPRGSTANVTGNPLYKPGEDGDWWPGTILDLVTNRKYSGAKLREKLVRSMRHITLNAACEQLPVETNYVVLAKDPQGNGVSDELGIIRPQINYKVDDPLGYVRNSFKKIVDVHAKVFEALTIKPQFQVLQSDNDGQPLNYGGSGHIMGTTRMGTTSKNSVVNKDCQSWDHENLFILGSSVFPTSSTANPTSTAAALSIRTVRAILRYMAESTLSAKRT